MIIKNLRRIIAGIVTMVAMFSVSPIAAYAEWKQNSTGWWYADGSSWYKGWKEIEGKWYFFDKNGYMIHDHYIDNSYLNSEGYWDGKPQAFSVKYPSNWIKSTDSNGKAEYKLDSNGPIVSSNTIGISGVASRQKVIDGVVNKFKSSGNGEVNSSQQEINGKTVDVLDYKIDTSKISTEFSNLVGKVQVHEVIFYNSNQAYMFTIAGKADISSQNMDAFNEMLKTVTF